MQDAISEGAVVQLAERMVKHEMEVRTFPAPLFAEEIWGPTRQSDVTARGHF